jgi:hypothetical protein|tara:strand:- start:1016 stop:1597 length:582 start_codon:yes stop_codon:yes gene_type:complete
MASKIKYHGKLKLDFKKIFNIIKRKDTRIEKTVDSTRPNFYLNRGKKELEFHKNIARWYTKDIQVFYRHTNKKLRDTLPKNFWKKFNLDYDTVRVQVMRHTPGRVSIPHVDKYNSFLTDINQTNSDSKRKKIKRIWITLTEPQMGHVLLVGDEVAYNLPKGTALEFPSDVIHSGGNIGYVDRYVMTVTGWDNG